MRESEQMKATADANKSVPISITGSWDSLYIGYSFNTGGRTITEADVVNFACLTGDFNSLHMDAEYAKASIFGQRIAHGLLVLSVLAGLTTQADGYRALVPYLVAFKDMHCAFLRPTFIGDTISGRIAVIEKHQTKHAGRGEAVFRREAVNQQGKVVVQADFRMLVKRDNAA